MIACLDSDVLIDYFNGVPAAAEELNRYDRLFISRISWIEVLVGVTTPEARDAREQLLRELSIVELDESVAREAISLRQVHRLKLPDAIIWASARLQKALLVTRNHKDFRLSEPGIRIPYTL